MSGKHRTGYWQHYYLKVRIPRLIARGATRPRLKREASTVISIKIPETKKQLWKEIAGPDIALSKFIQDAVDSYIEGLAK